ncbi:hypothetical protein B0O99DRAFT_626565 [Bisporella sp. PMI_857]|nr:hypothetical protein B0O99DRAFT_626565 [Bisporella sp. PMI_857]
MSLNGSSGVGDAASAPVASAAGGFVRACTNCVKAKARCSGTEGGVRCGRCERMEKECQPSPPVRKRRTAKDKMPSRTSKLEEKLDGLVQLLAQTNGGVNTIAIHSLPTPESSSGSTPIVLSGSMQLQMEDAEIYLNRFQTQFAKNLPCIIIPPTTTAQQLRKERPILWLSIMAVASHHPSQQLAISRELRETFGREAFVEARPSLDLLLAVLVYASWDRSFCGEKPIMSSLTRLATSILYDLGLHKPPSKVSVGIPGDDKTERLRYKNLKPRTMEDRRALLGCFLLNSITSYFLKSDSMRWTTYSAECLRMLEESGEFESDKLFVQIVKARLVAEKVLLAPWHETMLDTAHTPRPSALFYLTALENQLQEFKTNIPVELRGNHILLLELHNLEALVYEVGCSPSPDMFPVQSHRRIECLYACLNAVKSCIDILEALTPSQYIGLPFLTYSATSHSFRVFYRLLTFQHPDWDQTLVRQTLDFLSILNELEAKLRNSREDTGLDSDGSDFLDLLAGRIGRIKKWWEATAASPTVEAGGDTTFDGMEFDALQFVDEDWFNDLLGFRN